jgi:ADP-ribose pyrophosphatase YjhB (NUDIX family)
MISVQLEGQRFQVRAAAVVLHAGHLLVHRAPGDDYWALPGGRVEVGEEASATIVREMREELGEEVICGPLLHVAENFFDLAGRRNHEIGFYFLVSLADGSPHLDTARSYRGIESHLDLEFRWFALAELARVNLRPTFLQDSLASGTPRFSHAVQREY